MTHAEHSAMFSRYKNTKETLLANYTTNQYMTVLDRLLFAGFVQILDSSDFWQRPVAAMIAWYTLYTKRQISITKKPEAISNLIQFLLLDDGDAKIAAYKRAQIERNVTRCAMEHLTKMAREYRKLLLEQLHGRCPHGRPLRAMVALAHRMRLTTDHVAFGLAQNMDYWMDLETKFRWFIMEKYIRLVLNTANRDYKAYRFKVDVNEFIQSHAVAALKAIDKSSVGDMGTLTIYIQAWLKNSVLGTVTNSNYSVPYTVPPNKLSEHSQETVDMESPAMQNLAAEDSGETEEREAVETIRRVQLLAKAVDPTGVGRIFLGIGENLTEAEIAAI